jgi:hypothetical protein
MLRRECAYAALSLEAQSVHAKNRFYPENKIVIRLLFILYPSDTDVIMLLKLGVDEVFCATNL